MRTDRGKLDTVIGLAIVGGSVVGVASLVAALLAVINGEYLATGMCLTAAALSFGLLVNAVLRD